MRVGIMSIFDIQITSELVISVLTFISTAVGFISNKRQSNRIDAKQSLMQLIFEDQIRWELYRKLPINYVNIHKEYEIYHKNDGNGMMTKKVEAYVEWYNAIQERVSAEENKIKIKENSHAKHQRKTSKN